MTEQRVSQTDQWGPSQLSKETAWIIKAAIVLGIIIVSVGIAFGIAKIGRSKTNTAVSAAPATDVSVEIVKPAELHDTMTLPGVAEADRVVTVSAEVAGRIAEIIANEGAMVAEGDLLVRLDDELIRAEVARAEAQQRFEEGEYERLKRLATGGVVGTRSVEEALARMQVTRAEADLAHARMERTKIHAPISGRLEVVAVEGGEYVQAGHAVARIVDTQPMKIVVDVPEKDVGFLKLNDQAIVMADFCGDKRDVAGPVSYIGALATERTRATRVEVTLDNADECLRAGQIVSARLTRRVLKDAITAPLQAVIPLENGKAVFVEDNGVARQRMVELGIIRGDRVQITKGLQAGDRLIVSGQRFVADGKPVSTAPEQKQD